MTGAWKILLDRDVLRAERSP